MDTIEMITEALEKVVEQKVAEKSTGVNLDSVLEFIRNSTEDDREAIIKCFEDFHSDTLDCYFDKRVIEDDMVAKSDIDCNLIDELGILGDAFDYYLDNNDVREVVKDLIDRL